MQKKEWNLVGQFEIGNPCVFFGRQFRVFQIDTSQFDFGVEYAVYFREVENERK